MKNALAVAALAAVVLMPVAAHAAPMQVTLVSATGTVGGGEFGFAIEPGDDIDFLSFCMERGELISAGSTYFVDLSTSAKFGGVGGAVNGEDPLDPRTAYLYSAFVNGTLAGYNGSVTAQDALQLAIWRIEDELDAAYGGRGDAATRALADTFYQAAIDAGWQDIGNVRVARLWLNYDAATGFSGVAQDVLKVPEPGSLLLVGVGLLGLATRSRRRR